MSLYYTEGNKTKAKELEQEVALLGGQAAVPAALRFCRDVQGFVRTVCRAHHRLCLGRWCAPAAKRKADRLRRKLRSLCRAPLGYPRAEAFRQRLLGPEQKHFFTCFRRPGVPPTNNQAERSLRPAVIMRKIVHGTRSAKGLEKCNTFGGYGGHQPSRFNSSGTINCEGFREHHL